jgi:hypothetical protein
MKRRCFPVLLTTTTLVLAHDDGLLHHPVRSGGAGSVWDSFRSRYTHQPSRPRLYSRSMVKHRQRRRSPDRRAGPPGEPVLPQYRGDAGRQAGLVHVEGHGQDGGV